MIFACTSGNISFSFDGSTTHGIMTNLAPLNNLYFNGKTQNSIWLSGSGTFLVYAYAPQNVGATANELFIINSIKPFGISAVIGL